MGALHKGHASLIENSVQENDITVCSIFVNPTQFGEKKDLETYPKPIENDINLLHSLHCDVLFLPDVEEVYPKSYKQQTFAIGDLETKIEGEQRPGHFQGVCNVLFRFFEMVNPNAVYFGQKDFQQTSVVAKLLELTDSKIELRIVPIAREEHGLAMSSRNVRLSKEGRKKAAFINQNLKILKQNCFDKSPQEAESIFRSTIEKIPGAKLDYIEVVDTKTLNPVTDLTAHDKVVAVTVVRYEGVRLLDNIYIT
jgi:pantoate--beta-alanine ligase